MSIESPPLDRKLVAILAADVEGYSRLMHQDEEATLATLTSHRMVIDSLIAAAGGYISSTAGDSVMAEFSSVVEAVVCSVEIQRALATANDALAPERKMLFRIGLNVGDVMLKSGGVFGDGVNVAAHVEALAPSGGICVTRGVRDHVRDRLPYRFDDYGHHSVKNIPRPIHVYRLVADNGAGHENSPLGLAELPAASFADPVDVELTFWRSVEASGNLDEYQAYLERYPGGSFAALAQGRLLNPLPQADSADRAVELAFWDSVKDGEDPALFAAYLEKYPTGDFRTIAEIKLRALERR